MLGSIRASLQAFSRRNFTSTLTRSRDEEDSTVRPRSFFYSVMERVFGPYARLALYALIMTCLVFGAILSTMLYGDVSNTAAVSTVSTTPAGVAAGSDASKTAVSTVQRAQPPGFEIILLIIFSMSIFSLILLVLANRVWRGVTTNRDPPFRMSLAAMNAPVTSSNSGRLNQMLARLVLMGRVGEATALRSRLRMALMNRDFNGNDYEMLQSLDDQNPHQGATEGEISRLPVHVLTQANIDNNLQESSKCCSICLAPYEAGDSLKTVICLHQFHVDCIDTWLRTHASCPLCNHFATG